MDTAAQVWYLCTAWRSGSSTHDLLDAEGLSKQPRATSRDETSQLVGGPRWLMGANFQGASVSDNKVPIECRVGLCRMYGG